MKKNLYFRNVYSRPDVLKGYVYSFFLAFCSWPRMLIEVFIRKNQGERYFSFSGTMTLLVILSLLPLFMLEKFARIHHSSSSSTMMSVFFTWYLYLAGFLVMALKRRAEIRRLPSVFDFGRVSVSSGEIHPAFLNFQIGGKNADIRTIETRLEPGFFFIIGFILWMTSQPVGLLMVISSIIYRMSYKAAYYFGDQFIMNTIDEMIFNEEKVRSFVDGLDPSQTRGVRYAGRRPADPDVRRRLAEALVDQEEIVEAH